MIQNLKDIYISIFLKFHGVKKKYKVARVFPNYSENDCKKKIDLI